MSFYTSISGLKNSQSELSVISHNIANVETNGYKKSRTEFADIVASSATADPKKLQGLGARVESTSQNFSLGPVEQTGGALDMAITGDGFFTMRAEDGEQSLYTRNGAFSMDENGFLGDGSGNRLQGFAVDDQGEPTGNAVGDLRITPVKDNGAEFAGVTVGEGGRVQASYSDGSVDEVGQVALASFVAQGGLKQVGSSNWEATGLSGQARFGNPGEGQFGALMSGTLERSNVDVSEELVGLISAQRNFQANAKAIDTATQLSQTIMNLRS